MPLLAPAAGYFRQQSNYSQPSHQHALVGFDADDAAYYYKYYKKPHQYVGQNGNPFQ